MRYFFIIVIMVSFFSNPVIAQEPEKSNWKDIQLRFGTSIMENNDKDYNYIEISAVYGLPYSWQWDPGWEIETGISFNSGVLMDGEDDSAIIGSLGLVLYVISPVKWLEFIISQRAALMTDHVFDEEDLGGAFIFIEYIGVNINLLPELTIGCYYQHMSNAGIYGNNPGVNLQIFEIRYLF